MSASSFPLLTPKVVLGVAAHPDDLDLLDFGSTGTLALFAEQGAQVHYLIVTDGSKGSHDPKVSATVLASERRREQKNALKAIGGHAAHFLDYPDAELELTMELKKAIVRVVRQIKPDVVITLDPTFIYSAEQGIINHPDHRVVGQATLDALYPLARDFRAFPELAESGLDPHEVKTVLLANFNKGNFPVDITATMEKKMHSIAAHKSQIKDLPAWQERIKKAAKDCGRTCGYTYAECFVRIDVQP